MQAKTLEEYEGCTTELDRLQGHDAWKEAFGSIELEYNPQLIKANMDKLKDAVDSSDVDEMLHLIRTTLTRDLGGMGMLGLYKHSWFGTKRLIGDYIETAVKTIEKFQRVTKEQHPSTSESFKYLASLEDSLKYFGRSALTLSGGANLGMKHVGVCKTLWEEELLPDIISGASAGSIVAAIVATSTDKEMGKVLEQFPKSDLAVFDAPEIAGAYWLTERGRLFLSTRAFFAISNLERVMKKYLGNLTFREAYNKTKRILNVCVSSADSSEARLLNHVTAPNVYIWSAVCASCSVPFIFQPADISEKDPETGDCKTWMSHSQQWVDGSLDHDIPMRKLSEMFNVNFFIVSQVNPHVRFFLPGEEEFTGVQPTKTIVAQTKIRTGMALLSEEVIYRAQLANDWGMPQCITRGASVFNQQYTGDINILPQIENRDYLTMMANPTPEFMIRSTVHGERATWPKMCRVKNSVAIEKALISAINQFRDRVHFGPEAIKARQPVESSNRGRTRTRPTFLRRRSLSNETSEPPRPGYGRGSGPPSPSPSRGLKRNRSLGSDMEKLWAGLTPLMGLTPMKPLPSVLAPQAGVSRNLTTPNSVAPDSGLLASTIGEPVSAPRFILGGEGPGTETEEAYGEEDCNGFSINGGSTPEPPSSPIQAFKSFIGGRLGSNTVGD